MTATFAELVEEIRHRTPEEQEELRRILKQEGLAVRRVEIASGAAESQQLERVGQLEFSSDAATLLARLQRP